MTRIMMGPFIYSIQKGWRPWFGFCSEVNYEQLGDMIQQIRDNFKSPTWLSFDFSKLDMHQYAELLELYDVTLYDKIIDLFDVPEVLKDKIKSEYRNILVKIRMDEIYLTLKGTVPSGRNNTTEGNTRRVLLMIYTICLLLSFKVDLTNWRNMEIVPLVMGDDSLLGGEPQNIALFEQQGVPMLQKLFGQVLRNTVIGTLTAMRFLSLEFIEKPDAVRPVRPLERVFQMGPWTRVDKCKYRDLFKARKLLYADAKCLEAWGGDLPVIRALVAYGLKFGIRCNELEMEKYVPDYKRLYRFYREQDGWEGIYYNYLLIHYGITKELIDDFERKVGQASYLDILTHDLVDLVYQPTYEGVYSTSPDVCDMPMMYSSNTYEGDIWECNNDDHYH